MVEGIAKHEVAYSRHEAAKYQHAERPDGQQHQKASDKREVQLVSKPKIHKAGPKTTGDGRITAPLEINFLVNIYFSNAAANKP